MSPGCAPRAGGVPRGMTLIEIMIGLTIAAVLFSAVAVSVGAVTGAKAKKSAGELAGVMRALYDTAALTGKTCRLVFDLPVRSEADDTPVRYRAECAAGGVTTSRNREATLSEATKAGEEAERAKGKQDSRVLMSSSGSKGESQSLEELMHAEEQRVESASAFQAFSTETVEPRELPSGVHVAIWTRQQREYVESGVAQLYFFPQGYTEKAQVRLSQGNNTWTLKVSPLTGKVSVVSEALEVPRS